MSRDQTSSPTLTAAAPPVRRKAHATEAHSPCRHGVSVPLEVDELEPLVSGGHGGVGENAVSGKRVRDLHKRHGQKGDGGGDRCLDSSHLHTIEIERCREHYAFASEQNVTRGQVASVRARCREKGEPPPGGS